MRGDACDKNRRCLAARRDGLGEKPKRNSESRTNVSFFIRDIASNPLGSLTLSHDDLNQELLSV